jgi:hypothetical protein
MTRGKEEPILVLNVMGELARKFAIAKAAHSFGDIAEDRMTTHDGVTSEIFCSKL